MSYNAIHPLFSFCSSTPLLSAQKEMSIGDSRKTIWTGDSGIQENCIIGTSIKHSVIILRKIIRPNVPHVPDRPHPCQLLTPLTKLKPIVDPFHFYFIFGHLHLCPRRTALPGFDWRQPVNTQTFLCAYIWSSRISIIRSSETLRLHIFSS